MKQLKHILSAMMLMTLISAMAGTPPKKTNGTLFIGDTMTKNKVVDRAHIKNNDLSSDKISISKRGEHTQKTIQEKKLNANQTEDGTFHTVKCIIEGNCVMPTIKIYNKEFYTESDIYVWLESGDFSNYSFQIPPGTYDISLKFTSNIEGADATSFIIHENVTVDSDKEELFSDSELTEKIITEPLLPDGTTAVLPLVTYLEEEPWMIVDDTNATIKNLQKIWVLYKEGCEPVESFLTDINMTTGKPETVLSNKLSDSYHLTFQYFLVDLNNDIFISTADLCGIETATIHNYIDNIIKYECPDYSHTPLNYDDNYEKPKYNICQRSFLWIDNYQYGGAGYNLESSHPNVYYSIQPFSDRVDIKAPVATINYQAEETIHYAEDIFGNGELFEYDIVYQAEMASLPALYNGTQWEYINQNHSECGNYSYQIPESGTIVEYPGVPEYGFFSNQISQPFGNSAPILSLMTQTNKVEDMTIFRFEPNAYIGRYGEVRNCDKWELHKTVTINGKQVFDSEYDGDYDAWFTMNNYDGHEKGLLKATFTNRNVLIDENIAGFNITTVSVDERNEDLCTPTTQMLIFKNTDGAITDRFANAEDGIIEFSAGDFNWNMTEWYYTCDEAEVKVEYAPYGEDAFLPLEVEEIPENYYMPGFGYFYRGSLADVSIPSSNGWYDIRFTLTDKAGNEMVQHISPAFKIDKNVGVAEVAVNGTKVWAANGTVFAAGSDVAAMELFTADGKRIASSNGSSLSANGYRGIAIVKATAADGSVSTHKVAIR